MENTPKTTIQIGNIEMSAKTGKLFAAIARAQAKIKHPAKDKLAKIKMKSGGEYTYKYSDLPEVLDSTRALAEEGVAIVQNPSLNNGQVFVSTVLGCDDGEDGQWIGGMLAMSVADDHPQTVGAATSYARRYAAQSMAGIAAEDDNDANTTVSQTTAPPKTDPKASYSDAAGNVHSNQPQHTPNLAKAAGPISEAQAKRLFAIAREKKWDEGSIKTALLLGWGVKHTKDILRKDYDAIVKMIDTENLMTALRRLEAEHNPGPKPHMQPLPPDFGEIPF